MTTTINPRDVVAKVFTEAAPGGQITYTATHKPTGKSASGKADTYEQARAIALRDLEMAIEGRPNPTPGFVH